MISFERRQRLVNILKEKPGINVPELSRMLNVSEGTVRNDLNGLAEMGMLVRVRGGAVVKDMDGNQTSTFTTRSETNAAVKEAIARAAAQQIEDGDSLLLDASSTVSHLAAFLQDRRNLRIITNGIEVARKLSNNPYNTVILVGGFLSSDGHSISGLMSDFFLKDLHVKKAFVSSSGFALHEGLTEVNIHEAQLKRRMIACAELVIALVDSSKFGKVDLTSFVDVHQIHHLFTDHFLSADWQKQLHEENIDFTLCS